MSKNANRLVHSVVFFGCHRGPGVAGGKHRRVERVYLDVAEACVVWLLMLKLSCDDIGDVVSPGAFRATIAKNTGVGFWAAAECTGRLGASVWIEFVSDTEMASARSGQHGGM